MLSRWTFEYTPAREFVEKRLERRILNACTGRTKLKYDGEIVRNDWNPDRDVGTHFDGAEIADYFEPQSFDTVVFDPSFDHKQAETKRTSRFNLVAVNRWYGMIRSQTGPGRRSFVTAPVHIETFRAAPYPTVATWQIYSAKN